MPDGICRRQMIPGIGILKSIAHRHTVFYGISQTKTGKAIGIYLSIYYFDFQRIRSIDRTVIRIGNQAIITAALDSSHIVQTQRFLRRKDFRPPQLTPCQFISRSSVSLKCQIQTELYIVPSSEHPVYRIRSQCQFYGSDTGCTRRPSLHRAYIPSRQMRYSPYKKQYDQKPRFHSILFYRYVHSFITFSLFVPQSLTQRTLK